MTCYLCGTDAKARGGHAGVILCGPCVDSLDDAKAVHAPPPVAASTNPLAGSTPLRHQHHLRGAILRLTNTTTAFTAWGLNA